MNYLIIKSIHLIFVVSYFAGLFYMVRLFIYQRECKNRPQEEKRVLVPQFQLMQKRLWNIITVPAFGVMLVTGLLMLYLNPALLQTGWMHIKLTFILLLIGYHLWTWRTLKQFKNGLWPYTSKRLRMFNEVPTLILFVVVFLAVLKSNFYRHWYWVFICFVAIGVLIMLVVRFTKQKD